MHNAQKLGKYWLRSKENAHWANCHFCNETDSMDHILTECTAPEVKIIWKLAEILWRKKMDTWPAINNTGAVLACAMIDFTTPQGKSLTGANRLYRIIISESAYLIWKIRCKRLFEKGPHDEPISEKEIHNRWVKTINNRLDLDRSMTNKKFEEKAIPRRKVLKTWRKVIKNEKNLPSDWTKINGVIVSIGQMERHANENQAKADKGVT